MFRLIEPSSGQNKVVERSVNAYTTGSHIVYKIILTFKFMFYSVNRPIQTLSLSICIYI